MSDLKLDFEKLSLDFNDQQNVLNDLLGARSKLETQLQENKIVADEFSLLNEKSKIFKLIGPVLMPQDYNEAKINVQKRIEFINSEIKRVESKIEDEKSKIEYTRNKLLSVRSKMAS